MKSDKCDLDEDSQQRVKGFATFLLEFYKVCMGSFLTVFVPHKCSIDPSTENTSSICSISHNINHGDAYHTCVLWINLLSFALFLTVYRIELKRENWCINYLDIDSAKSAENLDDEIEDYPIIKKEMHELNTKYQKYVKICIKTQFINTILSVTDVGRSWAGSASLTPMLSYVLLIAMKLYSMNHIANNSIDKERAYSAYLTEPKTYNTIDKDHRHVVKFDSIEVCLDETESIENSHITENNVETIADSAPVETEPVETEPVEPAPHDTAPHDTVPHDTVPVETAPHETGPAPHETALHETAPVETALHDTVPVETAPHYTVPHDTVPVEPAPAQEPEPEPAPNDNNSSEKVDCK